nr:uncharacterized protein LOC119181908 [Rhipicephalus microplus]
MGDIFKGKSFIKKDGKSFPADTVLRDKQLICLYFAAQWCPPCRMFTPVLANVYKDARADNLAIEHDKSRGLDKDEFIETLLCIAIAENYNGSTGEWCLAFARAETAAVSALAVAASGSEAVSDP